MKKLVEIEFQRAFLSFSAMQFDMLRRNAANIGRFSPSSVTAYGGATLPHEGEGIGA